MLILVYIMYTWFCLLSSFTSQDIWGYFTVYTSPYMGIHINNIIFPVYSLSKRWLAKTCALYFLKCFCTISCCVNLCTCLCCGQMCLRARARTCRYVKGSTMTLCAHVTTQIFVSPLKKHGICVCCISCMISRIYRGVYTCIYMYIYTCIYMYKSCSSM